MNGFEPLRRRIIDYTEVGQWSEVYDGPLEDCESEKLKAENAKLREQIHWLKKGDILHVLTDQEFAEQQKHEREMQASIKALDDENAKLRELVRDMWEDVCNAPCCAYCDHSDYDGDKCELRDRMRELGVEV